MITLSRSSKLLTKLALNAFIAVVAVASLNSNAEIINPDANTQIYTSGFAISSASTDEDQATTSNNLDSAHTKQVSSATTQASQLGQVGSLNIIAGERPQNVVAYVKKTGAYSYLISDTILVKCKKDVACVPSAYNPNRLGSSNLYQIQVADYAAWESAIAELKNLPQVLKVAPKYNYGSKPKLN